MAVLHYDAKTCPPCNGDCNQGRLCQARMPAEAWADVTDEEDDPMTRGELAVVCFIYATSILCVLALVIGAYNAAI